MEIIHEPTKTAEKTVTSMNMSRSLKFKPNIGILPPIEDIKVTAAVSMACASLNAAISYPLFGLAYISGSIFLEENLKKEAAGESMAET